MKMVTDFHEVELFTQSSVWLCQGCLVHFAGNAIYLSLCAMELEKLFVSDKIQASCQTNMSPKHFKRYKNKNDLWLLSSKFPNLPLYVLCYM